MQIEISNDQYEKLTELALAAGFSDATAFISALAEQPAQDPRGKVSQAVLQENASQCDRSIAELDAGGGRDAMEALLEIGRDRGFERGK